MLTNLYCLISKSTLCPANSITEPSILFLAKASDLVALYDLG
jgi:hypothetical protein